MHDGCTKDFIYCMDVCSININDITFHNKLVILCFFPQLSKTNFSNNNDFRSFLQSLCATFKEFKMHEQIENEYIIGLLQKRCCTVYNVHSDNKLSEMLSLFEKGLHNVKVNIDALHIDVFTPIGFT